MRRRNSYLAELIALLVIVLIISAICGFLLEAGEFTLFEDGSVKWFDEGFCLLPWWGCS